MTKTEMTEAQALNEAVLLLIRKTRRLSTQADFNKIWGQLPAGAAKALYAAERQADDTRHATGGPGQLAWPVEADDDYDCDGPDED